jgi:DNA polymerase-4
MTGQEKFFGPPEEAAAALKDRIREELGFTVNVGIGNNKATAKMASEFQKPDRVHTLWQREIESKLWPQPIDFLFMAGRRTVKKLTRLGVMTVGDMAHLSPVLVKEVMGKNGMTLWHYANGRDESLVIEGELPPPKSISKSVTVPYILKTKKECEDILFYIAEDLAYKLREKGMTAAVVTVAIKDNHRCYFSRQQKFSDPVLHYKDICEKALPLLEMVYSSNGVKYVCLCLSELSQERSLNGLLFGRDVFREERLEEAVFALKKRYGKHCVTTARSLHSGADRLFRHFEEEDFNGEVMPRFY